MVERLRVGHASNAPQDTLDLHAILRLWMCIDVRRKMSAWLVAAIFAFLAMGIIVSAGAAAEPPRGPLQLIRTIPLPDLPGRIDHLAVDLKRHRLFLAALEKNTIELVDLRAGTVSRSMTGFNKPQGVFYLA